MCSDAGERPGIAYQVELNGRTAFVANQPKNPDTSRTISVGRNVIGSSASRNEFTGQWLTTRRLPVPTADVLPAQSELHLTFSPGGLPAGEWNPLAAVGTGTRAGLLAVRTLDSHRVELAYFFDDDGVIATAILAVSPARLVHLRMEFVAGSSAGDAWQPVLWHGTNPLWSSSA